MKDNFQIVQIKAELALETLWTIRFLGWSFSTSGLVIAY